jgi:methylmalonyl-CoA/ethylmalonyl-CoA epimerase
MFQRLHHVGIVTDDLDATTEFYERTFGARFRHRERLESEGVDVAIAALPQGGEIELLAPLRPDTGVARFLARRGPGLHHTGYAVPDLSAALEQCRAQGIELIDTAPRHGAGGLRVAFLHPRSTGRVLIELVESADDAHRMEPGRP